MIIKILHISESGKILGQIIKPSGEFPDKDRIPEEGEIVQCFFEKIEPEKVPEFNE